MSSRDAHHGHCCSCLRHSPVPQLHIQVLAMVSAAVAMVNTAAAGTRGMRKATGVRESSSYMRELCHSSYTARHTELVGERTEVASARRRGRIFCQRKFCQGNGRGKLAELAAAAPTYMLGGCPKCGTTTLVSPPQAGRCLGALRDPPCSCLLAAAKPAHAKGSSTWRTAGLAGPWSGLPCTTHAARPCRACCLQSGGPA